jgi:hypothetical protein
MAEYVCPRTEEEALRRTKCLSCMGDTPLVRIKGGPYRNASGTVDAWARCTRCVTEAGRCITISWKP